MTPNEPEVEVENSPVLHIFMFTDVPDMNPGKGIAQGAHAASKFVYHMMKSKYTSNKTTLEGKLWDNFEAWAEQGDGFGTKLVRECTRKEFEEVVVKVADPMVPPREGNVVDTSYPARNWYGDVYISVENTCAYVFTDSYTTQEEMDAIRTIPLHR